MSSRSFALSLSLLPTLTQPLLAPPKNPPRAPGAPAVREAYVDSTPRARVTSAAPNKPVPVPTAAPTRPVPVPTKAPNRPVPVPGDAPNKPVPVPKPKPKERGSDKFKVRRPAGGLQPPVGPLPLCARDCNRHVLRSVGPLMSFALFFFFFCRTTRGRRQRTPRPTTRTTSTTIRTRRSGKSPRTGTR